jgi:hypothetical protein
MLMYRQLTEREFTNMPAPKQTIAYEDMIAALTYNKETGQFAWRDGVRQKNSRSFEVGSIDRRGRRYISVKKKNYPAHRLAWFYVTKEWPAETIAPLNGDYLDLRFENLRKESQQDIAQRWVMRSDNKSGHRGVTWDKSRGRWLAGIGINGQRKSLGQYSTKEEAAAAVEAARAELVANPVLNNGMDADAREKARNYARCRGLWKRTVRNAAGVVGWRDLNEFIGDVGADVRIFALLEAIVVDEPIGPNNWRWAVSLHSQFDTSTTEGKTAYERAYREKNPFVKKDHDLRKFFGIGVVEFNKMLADQNGVCASCGRPEKEKRSGKIRHMAVDHCHKTGEIRGLLCGNCNRGIGKFEDSPALLRKAADYLERHANKKQSVPVLDTDQLKVKER